MRGAIRTMMVEKDKMRGLVPTRAYGSHDKVYGAYLNTLNIREDMIVQKALAAHPDPRFQEFLARVGRYKRMSLATIAKACDISLKEFGDWWNRAAAQEAIAVAQTASIRVATDMAVDAQSVQAVCDRCDGMTWIGAPQGLPIETPGYRSMGSGSEVIWIRDCPNCTKGTVRKPGDQHSRDRLLEMSGIIKKGAAVNVLVTNLGGASHASAISDLDKVMSIDV